MNFRKSNTWRKTPVLGEVFTNNTLNTKMISLFKVFFLAFLFSNQGFALVSSTPTQEQSLESNPAPKNNIAFRLFGYTTQPRALSAELIMDFLKMSVDTDSSVILEILASIKDEDQRNIDAALFRSRAKVIGNVPVEEGISKAYSGVKN